MTILSGTEKIDVKLSLAGKNMLKADGTFKATAGTKVIAAVKMGDKAPQSVRFVLK